MKNLQIDIAENGEISVAFSAPNARAAHVFVEALTAALNGLREIKPRPVVLPAVDATDPRIGKTIKEMRDGDPLPAGSVLSPSEWDDRPALETGGGNPSQWHDDRKLLAVGVSEEEFRRGVEEGRWKK